MASGSGPDKGHPYVLWWDLRPVPSIQLSAAVGLQTSIHMNLGLQQSLGQRMIARALMGSRDHRGFSRKSSPSNNLFFILDILLLLRTRAIVRLSIVLRVKSESKLQAAVYPGGPTQ